ncbi:hypothetical protein OG439_08335 [Amycolatopsis sp. NBC_01307]|uniref:hypothetical protein n=1 Tax=Amycolatopsis sp. NBC_01307 TaxID=2903561 RepID=UPI002E15B6F1|nr:hypothetical protein OG439_08335 [Amycolatopsis sp. NBC_01307]
MVLAWNFTAISLSPDSNLIERSDISINRGRPISAGNDELAVDKGQPAATRK